MKTNRITLALVLLGMFAVSLEAAPPSKRTASVFLPKRVATVNVEKSSAASCGFMSNPAKVNAKYGKWIRCTPDTCKADARCRELCD